MVGPAGGSVPDTEAFLAHTDDEVLLDSGAFTGMPASEAIVAITKALEESGQGRFAVTYRQRDWLVSRQRYWGAPIPIVYCDDHGPQPVPEDCLPVTLPEDVDFAPTGVSPLQNHAEWLTVECPRAPRGARPTRSTRSSTRPGTSSATAPPTDTERAWDPEEVHRWMPMHLYTGGAEHGVLHLLYYRFFVKALRDLGHLSFDDPHWRFATRADPGR